MSGTDLYRRWINELWNGPDDAEDLTRIARRLVAYDFVGHWPGQEVRGPAALAELIAQTKSMFTTLSFDIEIQPFAADGFVAARWVGWGSTTDGTDTGFFGNDILRVRDDRFTEYWVASAER